jgi:hypothetical protein
MTADQARIVFLEDALDQAVHTIEFLHGCLTEDSFSYSYPEQTAREIAEFRQLVPARTLCVHSVDARQRGVDCPGCAAREAYWQRRAQAHEALAADPKP